MFFFVLCLPLGGHTSHLISFSVLFFHFTVPFSPFLSPLSLSCFRVLLNRCSKYSLVWLSMTLFGWSWSVMTPSWTNRWTDGRNVMLSWPFTPRYMYDLAGYLMLVVCDIYACLYCSVFSMYLMYCKHGLGFYIVKEKHYGVYHICTVKPYCTYIVMTLFTSLPPSTLLLLYVFFVCLFVMFVCLSPFLSVCLSLSGFSFGESHQVCGATEAKTNYQWPWNAVHTSG